MEFREVKLFAPLKKHFIDLGYKVYCEVPIFYRGVDFVAVKDDVHIAVEMKTSFNRDVVNQAHQNSLKFHKTYIAFPATQRAIKNPARAIDEESERYSWCLNQGIGIYIVFPKGIILEFLEGRVFEIDKPFDFSQWVDDPDAVGGMPYQKGVSMGYYELKLIKEYVKQHPGCDWKEIYANVQNHYSSYRSLAGSMKQWRGFSLADFKRDLVLQ